MWFKFTTIEIVFFHVEKISMWVEPDPKNSSFGKHCPYILRIRITWNSFVSNHCYKRRPP